MPRGAASNKRQHGPNGSASARHENGLVVPGKQRNPRQLQQQRSHNNLKQHPSPIAPNAAEDAPTTTPSAPSTPLAQAFGSSDMSSSADSYPLRRSSVAAYSEASSAESYNLSSEDNHRRIDVNATKNVNVHRDTGPLDFALTVLRLCPLQDTIAILIILMQVPPLALSGIYMLFTLLTFVTSNGLTLSDVFEWNLGAPSLATVICVDAIVLLIWLFLWGPIQHVILDLAQMVIALGLGGGSSPRDGGSMKNTLICLSMILLSHVLRHTKMKYSPVGYLLGSSRFITPDFDDPLEALDSLRGYDKVDSSYFGWAKNLLAIHILTQGLVKHIRDWYLRRERRDSLAQTAADPEAGKTYSPDMDVGFSTPDSDTTSLQNSTAISTTKKKRKQSAQVRNRQPLWAALASTKIVVIKEYEFNNSGSDSAGSNATDIHNLGNAPFNTQPRQIWISYIGCDEVCFNTSPFPPFQNLEEIQEDGLHADVTKPFYVRVNNAIWQPTRMTAVNANEESSAEQGIRWSGDIYGLTPISNYECEFVCSRTHEVLFSTSVRTTQPKSADVDVTNSKAATPRSRRPDSPMTTLRTSIAAADSKLTEERGRRAGLRKEFHRKTNALKKENEKLSGLVQSAGTGDDKLRQKIQQNATQQKQAEQALGSLEVELKEFDKIPESLKTSHKSKKGVWTKDKAKYDGAVAEIKSFKATVDQGTKALEEEKNTLQARRNKIGTRIAKVDEQNARITDANTRGLDEVERRRQNRETFENDVARTEQDFMTRTAELEAMAFNKEQENMAIKSQLDAFHISQAAFVYTSAHDNYPEAAGQYASNPSGHVQPQQQPAPFDAPNPYHSLYQNSLWGPSPLASAFVPHPAAASQYQQSHSKARGRSSSMLSNVSGFTHLSEADDNWTGQATVRDHGAQGFPSFARHMSDGAGSTDGSGSLSGGSSGSGSARDPLSPLPS
ncbi:hypothetical protein F5Y16DRAFT_367270 [Xylariaceae sp. FL0255]|nr:hypothetical protein F5Y16DRAFT_367270 [Xylariaceae sp. FL0255]